MSNRIRAEVQLDHIHAEAVYQGIGERLRDALDRNCEKAPTRLHDLLDRFAELDSDSAPSIVPSSRAGF